jgi:hypothetical protein
MMNCKVADKNLDYVAGLLRSQIRIAQNLQDTLENEQLDSGTAKNDLEMLSRINRQIVRCHELLEWPRTRAQLVD